MSVQPLLTLIVSLFEVEPYVDEFLQSLAAQTSPLDDVQIIFVDDGSTDAAPDRVLEWTNGRELDVELIRQPNRGLSAARNAGLRRARGVWVSFPDPDDRLAPDYLSRVRAFLNSPHGVESEVICCRVVIFDDATGLVNDWHPLKFKFERPDSVVDLDKSPRFIHLQAASAFYRLASIRRFRLEFNPDVVPNGEDAVFTATYLLSASRATLGIVSSARYFYRRRTGSLVTSSWSKAAKYSQVLSRGYIPVLEHASGSRSEIPYWLQNLAVYELQWYLKEELSDNSQTANIGPELRSTFAQLAKQVLMNVDGERILDFDVVALSDEVRLGLLGLKGEIVSPTYAAARRMGGNPAELRVSYRYTGPQAEEAIESHGAAIHPAYEATREISFFDAVVAHERVLRVPEGEDVTLRFRGAVLPIREQPDHAPRGYRLATPLNSRRSAIAGLWTAIRGRDRP